MRDVRIYALVDPTNGRRRYVGKTMGTLRTRLLSHINDVKRGRVYIPRHRWIDSLLQAGQSPGIVELAVVPEQQWQTAEMEWIARLKSEGCDLLNATAGGDGLASYRHRDDTRRKQSAAAYERYQNPEERALSGAAVKAALSRPETREKLRAAQATHTPEHKAKFRAGSETYARSDVGRAATSARFKGRVYSEETRARMSAARMGHKPSAETIAKRVATITGRKHTPEHNARIAEAHRRMWAARRAEAERQAS